MPLEHRGKSGKRESSVDAYSPSRAPAYAPPPSTAYPAPPRTPGERNSSDLTRRDQMAWETYEVRSRQMRRVREGADDMSVPRPSREDNSPPARTPQTTDSLPSDANELEEDALFAARNLRLMHARRRRAEGGTPSVGTKPTRVPSQSSETLPPATSASNTAGSSSSMLPPLLNRSSTPNQQRRSSTPSINSDPLPRLQSPLDGERKRYNDLVAALQKDEGFIRSSHTLEEQASRTQIEKKFKLHSKVAYLKENERELTAKEAKTQANRIAQEERSQKLRLEAEKQINSIIKEEMSGRIAAQDAEVTSWVALLNRHQESSEAIRERTHLVRPHTDVAVNISAQDVHAKATALVEARRASHRRAINTACQLIIDEEDLERDDVVAEWEESLVHQLSEPYYHRLRIFLSAREAKNRGELERLQERVFHRDAQALKRYLLTVEPLQEAYHLESMEILKHSESALELLNGHAKAVVGVVSDETAARWAIIDAESTMTKLRNSDIGKFFTNIQRASNAFFRAFSSAMGLYANSEMEIVRRELISIEASQSLLYILELLQSNVEGNSKFNDWHTMASEIFRMDSDKKQLLYNVVVHAMLTKALVVAETHKRLAIQQDEFRLRSLLIAVDQHLVHFMEFLDDHRAIEAREMQNSKNELLHRSQAFKMLPAEIQVAARRIREKDPTFDTFEVNDAAAYTPADFAKLKDILAQAAFPLKRVHIRCGSSHALYLYECNPEELSLVECNLEDIDASSLGFLEHMSSPSCRLTSLVLDGNDLTDVTIRKYLRVLKYKNNKITHVSIKENVDVPDNLQHALLYLAELNTYTETFKRLMIRAQENDVTLLEINLNDFSVAQSKDDSAGKKIPCGDPCTRLLCLSLQNNTHCTTVDVANFGMGENGARNLATLLRANRNLTKVDVSNNCIGMAGVALLAQAAATVPQKPVIIFWNNFTIAEVEKEEAGQRRLLAKFEEFQHGFVTAFAELSEGRVLRLSQMYEKKQGILIKYEAPFVRQKLIEEHQHRERVDQCEDEGVVRGLIIERFGESLFKLKTYVQQRIKEVERLSRDRSSMLLYHTVLLEMELERSSKVTLLEKWMRRQSLLDAEFWFKHFKVVEDVHEAQYTHLQLHHGECMDFYLKSEAEVLKIAEVLHRQPYAIREIIFNEKLKMMQRLEVVSPTPRPPSPGGHAASAVVVLPGVVVQPAQFTPSVVASTPLRPAQPQPTPPPALTPPPMQRSVSPTIPVQSTAAAPLDMMSPQKAAPRGRSPPNVDTQASFAHHLLPSPNAVTPAAPTVTSIAPRAVQPSQRISLQLGTPSVTLPAHPPLTGHKLNLARGLITSRDDFRPDDNDDYPVTDESIMLIHDIVCNGGAPVDRLNLAHRAGHVNFTFSMPLIEVVSQRIESLDLSGCGLGDEWVPAIIRMISGNHDSRLKVLSIKDNKFSETGLAAIVDAVKSCNRSLVELLLGNDDEAVQATSVVRRLRDQTRFYLAMRGHLGGRFKKLLIDVENDESFVKVLDFSHTVSVHRKQKKMRKIGQPRGLHSLNASADATNMSTGDSGGEVSGYDSPSPPVHDRDSGIDGDGGILSENSSHVAPPLTDEAMQLICFALTNNHHVYSLSLRGNDIGEEGGRRFLKYLRENDSTTPLKSVDLRDNCIPEPIYDEICGFFENRWKSKLQREVIDPETASRAKLIESSQYDKVLVPMSAAFLATLRDFHAIEQRWILSHSEVYDFFVAQGKLDLAVVDPEAEHRKNREHVTALFYEKARTYLMLLNYRVEKYGKFCAQKKQMYHDEEVMSDSIGKLILSLDPALQAVAVHVARNNRFVDMLDLSSTPHEPRCSDEVIAIMSGLMKQNTYVKEVSFANSGGYFNPHRSMPLIAEMGTRLETLDLTNCHLTDGHVGALTAMLLDSECAIQTLVLDDNYFSSVGARKLAKAVRNAKCLSCISLQRNSNMSLEDQRLLQFYCDLNKYTEAFKETILRVEANDPTLKELHFDRKGNLDERAVFDDICMRLLCAALPHNTHVERIFLMGNHVSDEGAVCLLNLLKSKVNRSVYFVDLSGNDVSPALVDELSRLVLIRLKEQIEQTVFAPEDSARTLIQQDDRTFWFWIERMKRISHEFGAVCATYEKEKDTEIQKLFYHADIDFHILQHERKHRQALVDEERMFGSVFEYVHESMVRGYQPIVLDYMRAMRRVFMSAQHEIEDLLEELDRQPNIELRKNALYILNNMRRIDSLDMSSTLPSDFCEQEVLCNGRSVEIALRILTKNRTVKRLALANNAGRIPSLEGIWALCTRLEYLDLSRCGLSDFDVPDICRIISDPQTTLKELILDGNLFSEVGALDIMRVLRHNTESRSDFQLTRLSLLDCPHVSENVISTIELISDLLRCNKEFRDLMLKIRFGTDELFVVEAQNMGITDDLCKLLCLALKPHKSLRSIKLRGNHITDIGVDYLCRLVRSTPSIEFVDILDNDVSSIARRQLASLLEERLGRRIGNDVQTPEEFHREDIIYEESLVPRFFWHYNKIAPNVFRHYQRIVDVYINYAGKIWGIDAVFKPETEVRKAHVEALELQQRMLLSKWMQYHQWISGFCERTNKQKAQWLTEGAAAVRELAALVAVHPSRELREKAFKLALNAPNVLSISLVQQCDENAVVILGKVLKGNTRCKEINLSGNHHIKPSWILPLIAEANTDVEILNLSDCNLRDGDAADPLRHLLSQSKSKLLKVVLDRNFLTQGTMQRVVPVLRESNHSLLELSVKHNPELARIPLHYLDFCLELNKYVSIGHEHGKREDYLRIKSLLIEVEANRPDITTLNFVNDEYALLMLDDQFAKLVCIALAYNTHVRTLYIRGHQITDRGAQYILQVLQSTNRTLDFVDLHGNFVSDSMLLAIEYAIPWRLYAADLDRLLASAVSAFQSAYDAYEAYHYACKKDHQLYIIRPCFDAKTEIQKTEDTVYRKMLARYPEWLRFADAWHKSYKYAFQRTFLQAEETLPIEASHANRSLLIASNFVEAVTSPKKSQSKFLDAVSALKAQMLPDFLREKYLKFVSLTDLYEQKCISALEKVFSSCSPLSGKATEAYLANAFSAARLPSIYIPPEKAASIVSGSSSTPIPTNLSFDRNSFGRAASPPQGRRSPNASLVSVAKPQTVTSPNLARSGSWMFGSPVESMVVGEPDQSRNESAVSPLQLSVRRSYAELDGSPSHDSSLFRVPSMALGDSVALGASRNSGQGSQFFSSSQFADISGLDEEKLLLRLVARYERLHEQVLAYENKCAQLLQSQFRLAANDLAFVGRNRKIHGPQCDARCVCAIQETSVDAARKLHDRLAQRFTKYVTQVANFEDVCVSTLNSTFDESRLALIELRNLMSRKSEAEIAALKALFNKLQNRFERYVATVDDFEKKCYAALQKAFDIHAAPVERQIEDAVMKRQIVDERLAEAAELHHKLHQRYLRYESVMADFEVKCRASKERFVKPEIDHLMSLRRGSMGSREKRTVSFVDSGDESSVNPTTGMPTVKSFFSSPTKANPAVIRLQARFEKYKQQVDEFESQCQAAFEAMFLREKSKVETGSTMSFRRTNSSVGSRESTAVSDMLNRAPSLRRVDSMAAIISPDAKTEQALQLLPTQPLALQKVGRLIANNDPNVKSLDLSSTSDSKPVTDTTIGILFTLLRSNNQLTELNLSNQGHKLTITSMKLISRLGRKLQKFDLSNGMVENQLLAPTICAMLSVPECTLTSLNLDNNKLTQEGVLQIMQVLRKTNDSLNSISLVGNEAIDKASISFLNFYCDLNKFNSVDGKFKPMVLRAEKNDENLNEILLKNAGYVDDLGLRCLCVALARNNNVSVVNLCGNNITDRSVKHLVQLMSLNTSISRLDLSANRFSQDAVSTLRKAASESKSLTHFII